MPTKNQNQDHKIPKLTKKQLEIANVIHYFDERMINLVEQIRAVAMAAGVTAEQFQKFFSDKEAQEAFYIKLHVAEDNAELQAKKDEENKAAELGKPDPAVPAGADFARQFAPPTLSQPEDMQSK